MFHKISLKKDTSFHEVIYWADEEWKKSDKNFGFAEYVGSVKFLIFLFSFPFSF